MTDEIIEPTETPVIAAEPTATPSAIDAVVEPVVAVLQADAIEAKKSVENDAHPIIAQLYADLKLDIIAFGEWVKAEIAKL